MRKSFLLFICMGLFLGACSTTSVNDPSAYAVNSPAGSVSGVPAKPKQYATAMPFADKSNAASEARLKLYGNKQEFLDRVTDRATPYIYYIVEELERRNMPLDLALLPIVE